MQTRDLDTPNRKTAPSALKPSLADGAPMHLDKTQNADSDKIIQLSGASDFEGGEAEIEDGKGGDKELGVSSVTGADGAPKVSKKAKERQEKKYKKKVAQAQGTILRAEGKQYAELFN